MKLTHSQLARLFTATLAVTAILASTVGCTAGGDSSSSGAPTDAKSNFTVEGTVDGGGGNSLPQSSSLLQVQSVFDRIKRAGAEGSVRLFSIGDDWKFAREKGHQILLKDISEKASGLLQTLLDSERVVLQTGDCFDLHSGTSRDGSARGIGINGTICLSSSRLQRVPPRELPNQVVALLLHEVVHLLGYGEDLAQYAQSYYLRDVANSSDINWTPPCSFWDNSPISARCMLGVTNKAFLKSDSQLGNLERIKFRLDQHKFNCTGTDGQPLRGKEFLSRLTDSTFLSSIGAPGEPKARSAFLMNLLDASLAYRPTLSCGSKSISDEVYFPKLNSAWNQKGKMIDSIIAETCTKWISIYPEPASDQERQFSACQADEYRELTAFHQTIVGEHNVKIHAVLEFD